MPSHMLGTVDLDFAELAPELEYLRTLPRLPEVYDEFSTGDYRNFSLWNATGDLTDSRYRDIPAEALRTEFGERCPRIEQALRGLFEWEHVTMVRARNLMNAVIFPHRDFIELEKPPSNYYRAFVALDAAPHAYHSDASGVFQMQPGEVWQIDAASVHSAANLTSAPRLHLCIDFAFDHVPEESELFLSGGTHRAPQPPTYKLDRAAIPDSFLESLPNLGRFVSPATFVDTLSMLTRAHYLYESWPAAVWDWLDVALETCPFAVVRERAAELREHVLNCRGFQSGMDLGHWPDSAFNPTAAA